jgi:predicted DNA binding CopG/RHH family protein
VKLKTKGYVKTKSGFRSIIVRIHENDVAALDKAAAKKGLTRSQGLRAAVGKFTGFEPVEPRSSEAE